MISIGILRETCSRRCNMQLSRYCRHAADRRRHQTCAVLDPDNASILVAGGGGIALDVTRRLKDMGSWVWMLQRSDSRRQGLHSCFQHATLISVHECRWTRTSAVITIQVIRAVGRPSTCGHAVPCRAEIEGMMAIVVRGDALDAASVDAAFGQVRFDLALAPTSSSDRFSQCGQ
jgi:hypothetical protein